jgi:two-component system chemotaxis response regulator CheY
MLLVFQREARMTANATMPILVVDDYKTTIKIVHGLLRQLGFDNLDEAANGEEAMRKLRQKPYQLVISDWNMEPMTGFELLKSVRADASLRAMPFIMITAESKTENVVAAKQAGANNYIVKPFNAQTLRQKMTSIFGEF